MAIFSIFELQFLFRQGHIHTSSQNFNSDKPRQLQTRMRGLMLQHSEYGPHCLTLRGFFRDARSWHFSGHLASLYCIVDNIQYTYKTHYIQFETKFRHVKFNSSNISV